jgi:hypothetical protein
LPSGSLAASRPDFAGSSHRRPLANARDLDPPFPHANSLLINPGARVTEIFLSSNREDQVAESVAPAKN